MTYAELSDTDELVSGEPVSVQYTSRSFNYTIDGVTYSAPRNWMTAWSPEQNAAAHMWPLTTNETSHDPDRTHKSGDAPTYSLDTPLTTVTQTYTFVANEEPASLDSYKDKAYVQVDSEASRRQALAEATPSIGEDYTNDDRGRERANAKRDNRAKKKNNNITDADDHLLDHFDEIHDADDLLCDDIEDSADYDEVDVHLAALPTDARWPTWVPE